MADPQNAGLSSQDIQDLAAIRKGLPAGDPRGAKIDTLLNSNPNHPAGLPAGMTLPGMAPHAPANMPTPAGASVVPAALQLGEAAKGVVKGAMHTGSNLLHAVNAPILPALANTNQILPSVDSAANNMEANSNPSNTAQKIGYGGEQVGEFFTPTGLEEGVAAHLGQLGPAAKVAGKLIGAGMHSGTVNVAQGGNFGTGAVSGIAGSGIEQGLAAVAPHIAESALNIRKLDRAYGKNGGAIGQAILDKTTGITPGAVADSAQGVLDNLNPQLNAAVDRASIRPATVPPGAAAPQLQPNPIASLGPARNVLSNAIAKATNQGERTTLSQLDPLTTHLGETISGNPIPSDVTPRQLLDLKRGFGNEFIHRWNPDTMNGVKGTAAQTYHALGDELNNVVPQAAGLNSQISTMIPVAKRAESIELNAPTTQKLFQRIAAPTGALTGAAAGGAAGYEHGGKEGALEGAAAGLMAPLLLTSPTGQMVLARSLNGLARPISKLAVGTGLQMSERNNTATAPAPR